MVGSPSPPRRRVVPRRLLALCLCGSVLALGAVPALALGDEEAVAACPGPSLEVAEDMPQPEREVRGLRNDLRALCEVTLSQGELAHSSVAAVGVQVAEAVEQLESVAVAEADVSDRLGAAEGLPVRVASQGVPIETLLTNSAEGSAEDRLASVEEAVLTDAETGNSNMWGIAGLFVGFMTLFALFKVVRP